MAATDVQLIRQESGIVNGALTATRYYQVTVEAGGTSETARTAAGIPQYNSLFAPGNPARARSIKARNIDTDQLTYEVVVEYSTDTTTTSNQQEPGQNPLDQPPRYQFGGSVITEPFFRDESPAPDEWDEQLDGPWLGKPVVTSAGEDFQQLPERQKTLGTLTITRNEASYQDWLMEQFKNTTNDSSITINSTTYPAGTLLMNNITASGPHQASVIDPQDPSGTIDVDYFTVTYELSKSASGFDFRPEDRGRQALHHTTVEDTDGQPIEVAKAKPIIDATGQEVKSPWPLDGQGNAKPNATDQPAVLTFRRYPQADWLSLNLHDPE